MSAPNLMTLTKRTSLNVYGADIFTCSRQLVDSNSNPGLLARELGGAAGDGAAGRLRRAGEQTGASSTSSSSSSSSPS